MSEAPDLIGLFIRPLEDAGVEYMITGGVASVIYGDPRFTRDVDIVVELNTSGIADFIGAFDSEDFYLPPPEVLEEEVGRPEGGHFNVLHHDTALRADVYLAGEVRLHRWALDRVVRLPVGATTISVAPIEYVILRKLQYFRDSGSDRHLRDISMMLRLSGDTVDRDALKEWCERLELEHLLETAARFDPEG
ncbi:MAG: nucleotidyl transferase AbiEii/AbiGii toxin family protein [Gemmatimonadetes bacterium]|nr:nucleotidyl transferase AbiEii/AbiGii toxin family protein [Gemmatimonadota bacterium]MBT8403207.1 nucleotidyl transferase AbiEii/AbiGii toxin family protein [Gemmatimonadota bacterium]NNF37970.1 nucleotidyl transferase AbiEii/AbiGii toxin family protein [Gemmatimonadota bacterium]